MARESSAGSVQWVTMEAVVIGLRFFMIGKKKASRIKRLTSSLLGRGDKIRTCDHTPPRRVL